MFYRSNLLTRKHHVPSVTCRNDQNCWDGQTRVPAPQLCRAPGVQPEWCRGKGHWHWLFMASVGYNKHFAPWDHVQASSSAAELEHVLFWGKIVGTWAVGHVGGAGAVSLPVPELDSIFLLHWNSPLITVEMNDYLAIRAEGNSSSSPKSWKNVSCSSSLTVPTKAHRPIRIFPHNWVGSCLSSWHSLL